MIVQTFSLNDLLNGKEESVSDPLADFRKLSYRDQLEDLQRSHHDKERCTSLNRLILPFYGNPWKRFSPTFRFIFQKKMTSPFLIILILLPGSEVDSVF